MKALICERCGAPINPKIYKCDYCDTQYENNAVKNINTIARMRLATEYLTADYIKTEYLTTDYIDYTKGVKSIGTIRKNV